MVGHNHAATLARHMIQPVPFMVGRGGQEGTEHSAGETERSTLQVGLHHNPRLIGRPHRTPTTTGAAEVRLKWRRAGDNFSV